MSQDVPSLGGRWPEIDGIRGLLSIIVVLGHIAVALGVLAFANMQPWYWMPMDVFFVISGFLLGRIAIANTGKPGFLKSYFARRVLRIWPAYYAVVLTVSLTAALIGAPGDEGSLRVLLKQLSFLQFTEYLAFGERDAYLRGLLHSWSVAIEEHFYALLPFLVALLGPLSRRKVVFALASLSLAALLLRLLTDMHAWVLATRMHSFAMGLGAAFVTAWARHDGSGLALLRHRVVMLGLLALSLVWLFASPLLPYERLGHFNPTLLRWVSQSVAAAAFTTILLLNIQHSYLVGRGVALLRNRFLVHLGEISYSTYLWHWPVLLGLASLGAIEGLAELPRSLLAVTAIFIVANVSYYGIERPFLQLKRLWAYAPAQARSPAT